MNPKRLSASGLVDPSARIQNSTLGAWTEVGAFSVFDNVTLGDYSYNGQNCIIQNADIGKFSNIAASVRIGPTDHPMERASLHHFTYRRLMYGFDTHDDDEFFAQRSSKICTIGHDTWLGHGVIVMNGVNVGTGSVVGSGAIVTKDIPPYSVAVGVPARVIKQRFRDEIAQDLMDLAWWDWSHDLLKERLESFVGPVEEFIRMWKQEA